MGMDVYGKRASDKSGEYFRNNVWWWRPLQNYVRDVAPEITNNCEHWSTNDGDGLNEEQSIALADKLQVEIDSGNCEDYAIKHSKDEGKYPFSVENVQEFTQFLRHCGGFEIL